MPILTAYLAAAVCTAVPSQEGASGARAGGDAASGVARPPHPASAPEQPATGTQTVRFATFNVALQRARAGALIEELAGGESRQAHAVAEIVQRVRPDVLLLTELDHDPRGEALDLLQRLYFARPHGDAAPIRFPHVFLAPVNTGEPTGLDLDRDGRTDGPGDAFGYGAFPGQYGMAVLSRLPIQDEAVRTFRLLRWGSMPSASWPDDAATPEPDDWYPTAARAELRLSSKSHWDVPLRIAGRDVHFLVCHPTPPVFDGPEDRNGRRNRDEIRFWIDYLDRERSGWIRDDRGRIGGLPEGAAFVLAGDLNADPADGEHTGVIESLLRHPRIDATEVPASDGGASAARDQRGVNARQRGDPRLDTSDFDDAGAGNLRLDYVLPSRGLLPRRSGVFWPAPGQAGHDLVGDGREIVSSDHRLVWLDVDVLPVAALEAATAAHGLVGQPFGDLEGARFLQPFAFADHELTLIRWWTEGCPFCADSLPALDTLRQRHAARGLAVVGMYHPKPARPVDDSAVRRFAAERAFAGFLAMDPTWTKLAELWTRGAPDTATSISVLVDRDGRVVWVHPGPRLHPSERHPRAEAAYRELEALLARRLP